jgi:hypothetical protein
MTFPPPHPDSALTFDEVEDAGLDGTLRDVGLTPIHRDRIVNAAQQLVGAWAGYGATDNACHMTRTEMEAMADLFVVFGEMASAADLIEAWIEAEIDDGEAERGDWTCEDHGLGPVLVDNLRMTCATCGRIGNRDDAIYIGGPCQDPCEGTIIRYTEGD